MAHAMRAQVLQIKWILMRYGYVGDSNWSTVVQLYEQAQSGGYLDEVIDIYGGAHGKGTLRQEFLRTLMLGVSSTGGLSPVKQNFAERAIPSDARLPPHCRSHTVLMACCRLPTMVFKKPGWSRMQASRVTA